MTIDTKALRPCPFCKSDELDVTHSPVGANVTCRDCGACGPHSETHADDWNRLAALELELERERDSNTHAGLRAAFQKQAARADALEAENQRLLGLLQIAECPACDGSGAIPRGPTPYGGWELEQCQWCDERKSALATGGDK